MKLTVNDEIDAFVWNSYVGEKIFHRYEWKRIICDTYGLTPLFLMAESNDGFSLYPGFLHGRQCVSIPYLYVSGWHENSHSAHKSIILEMSKRGFMPSYKTLDKYHKGDRTITAIVNITDHDEWFAKLSSKMRNQLRRSESNHLYFVSERYIDTFYSLYSKKMHELGTPAHKKCFFLSIIESFEQAEVFSVYRERRPLASMFCIAGRGSFDPQKTMYIMWASSSQEGDAFYANYFLYWNVIKNSLSKGIYAIDLGTAQYDSPQMNFKMKWNPQILSVKQNGGTTKHYKDKKVLRIMSMLWKKLPFSVVSHIGPHLRKYLL